MGAVEDELKKETAEEEDKLLLVFQSFVVLVADLQPTG